MNIWYGTGENKELSNLAYRPFKYKGIPFITVEHAYQSFKSGRFCKVTWAKDWRAGSKFQGTKIADHNRSKEIMTTFIRQSFFSNPTAARALLATGKAVLTHRQDKGFWATAFPEILMTVRDELRPAPFYDIEK